MNLSISSLPPSLSLSLFLAMLRWIAFSSTCSHHHDVSALSQTQSNGANWPWLKPLKLWHQINPSSFSFSQVFVTVVEKVTNTGRKHKEGATSVTPASLLTQFTSEDPSPGPSPPWPKLSSNVHLRSPSSSHLATHPDKLSFHEWYCHHCSHLEGVDDLFRLSHLVTLWPHVIFLQMQNWHWWH
jgi:hypothetical protein